MMKIAVFVALALVQVCVGQDRPVIPETFQATGEIEAHMGITVFGRFFWASDVSAKTGVENSTYDIERELLEVKRLARLDLGEEFFYRNERNHSSCETRKITDISEIWSWLQYAEFSGTVKFRHLDLNLWSYDLAGVHVELGVNTTHPNIPVLLNRYFPLASELLHFTTFETTGIRPTDFTVPSDCKQ